MKKSAHIVINGRRYDAENGGTLSHARKAAKPAVAASAPPIAAPKPITAIHKPSRKAAGHIAAHRPKPARTLMRQSVRKPPASLKRRIRVQGRLDSQILQPEVPAPTRTSSVRQRVPKGRKVRLISHFSPDLFTVTTVVSSPPAPRRLISDRPIVNRDVTPPHGKPAFAPQKPRSTAELLEYAIRFADAPPEPEEQVRRKHGRRRVLRRHAHAVAH